MGWVGLLAWGLVQAIPGGQYWSAAEGEDNWVGGAVYPPLLGVSGAPQGAEQRMLLARAVSWFASWGHCCCAAINISGVRSDEAVTAPLDVEPSPGT